MDVMYVHCTNCGKIVGLPYGEDLHDLDYGEIPTLPDHDINSPPYGWDCVIDKSLDSKQLATHNPQGT